MIMFKKTGLFMVLMLSLWMAFSVSFAAEAPYYDTTYDAFYANGTDIVIDTNAENQTVITWNGGSEVVTSSTEVYGGGREGSFYETSSIVMNGGEVSSLIGGGASILEEQPAIVQNTNIIVNDGTVLSGVFGGGVLYAEVNVANVTINGGTIEAVCGGGVASATVDGVYYSIGTEENPEASPNRTNEANVIINDGTIGSSSLGYGLVFGGGQGYSYTGSANVIIESGDLSTAYVTAGGSNGYTGNATMEIDGGNIYLVQSVNRGTVEDAFVEVTGGTIQKFYVGGETEDISVTGTISQIETCLLGGTIQSLNAGKSNSSPITIDGTQYSLLKTDDVVIVDDQIPSGETIITYQIEMPSESIEMEEGTSMPLVVTIKTFPEGYERLFDEITYQSSDTTVATISSDGMISALKEGKATITAKILEEQASMEVLVEPVFDTAWIWITISLTLLLFFIVIGSWHWYYGEGTSF